MRWLRIPSLAGRTQWMAAGGRVVEVADAVVPEYTLWGRHLLISRVNLGRGSSKDSMVSRHWWTVIESLSGRREFSEARRASLARRSCNVTTCESGTEDLEL